MTTQELDYIEQVLNSPFSVDDSPFDSEFNVDAAIDAYIDQCMTTRRNADF